MIFPLPRVAAGALFSLVLALPGSTLHAAEKAAPAMVIPAIISGTVAYRERIALPAGSEAVVQLLDTSQANAPATVIAEQRLSFDGHGSASYRLDYDAVNINPKGTYQVAARIQSGKKLLFVTEPPAYVITRGSPGHVDLVLTKAGAKPQ
ncbi:MAG: YbaY family lipoprotein [Rhodocyclaceae bacterium]